MEERNDMPSYNKVMLLGNLTRDPEKRHTSSGLTVVGFGMAVNRKFRSNNEDKEEVLFIDVTAFGKIGDIIVQHCAKGASVFVDGRLKMDQWQDRVTGDKRSKLALICENIQFLSRSENNGQGNGGTAPPPPSDDGIPF